MIIWSYDHMIIWSYDRIMETIIWSYDRTIIWSYGHRIIWSYDHMVIWSYGHMIIWTYDHMIIWSYTYMSYDHITVLWPYHHLTKSSYHHIFRKIHMPLFDEFSRSSQDLCESSSDPHKSWDDRLNSPKSCRQIFKTSHGWKIPRITPIWTKLGRDRSQRLKLDFQNLFRGPVVQKLFETVVNGVGGMVEPLNSKFDTPHAHGTWWN